MALTSVGFITRLKVWYSYPFETSNSIVGRFGTSVHSHQAAGCAAEVVLATALTLQDPQRVLRRKKRLDCSLRQTPTIQRLAQVSTAPTTNPYRLQMALPALNHNITSIDLTFIPHPPPIKPPRPRPRLARSRKSPSHLPLVDWGDATRGSQA